MLSSSHSAGAFYFKPKCALTLDRGSSTYEESVSLNASALAMHASIGQPNEAIFNLLRASAEKGNLAAIYNLGLLHARYDDPLATTYLRIAAKADISMRVLPLHIYSEVVY
jgi:TPR repeat protein